VENIYCRSIPPCGPAPVVQTRSKRGDGGGAPSAACQMRHASYQEATFRAAMQGFREYFTHLRGKGLSKLEHDGMPLCAGTLSVLGGCTGLTAYGGLRSRAALTGGRELCSFSPPQLGGERGGTYCEDQKAAMWIAAPGRTILAVGLKWGRLDACHNYKKTAAGRRSSPRAALD